MAREALSFAESIRQPGSLLAALLTVATSLVPRGKFDEAIPLLERATETGRQPGLAAFYPGVAARLGRRTRP